MNHEFQNDAVHLARDWTMRAATRPVPASAQLLRGILADPAGLNFTLEFVDRVIRPHDDHTAARALTELSHARLSFLPAPLALGLASAGAAARVAPGPAMAVTRRAFRAVVGDLVVDAHNLGPALRRLRAGNHLNINLLGEAVLGSAEAQRRLAANRALVERDDVDYLSLKVSAVLGPHNPWDFDGAVARAVQILRPFMVNAAKHGTFINLDMEGYADLDLTLAVFTAVLESSELLTYRAGIVLQAYLPEALGAMMHLQEWAAARVARGGAPIKVRLVKGANLAMERVDAEVHGWEQAPWASKVETDANYKRVLLWAMTPERMEAVHLGIAGHNLFDLAFAQVAADARGVDRAALEFELLAGMASGQAEVIAQDVGGLRLYVPVVDPREFDTAIAYLVRRLEENAAPENFMSGIFDIASDESVFVREQERFVASLALLERWTTDGTAPQPRRRARAEAHTAHGFANTPDTDPSLGANRQWAREIMAAIPRSTRGQDAEGATTLGALSSVTRMVNRLRTGGEGWAARTAAERAEVLAQVAELFEERRGELIEVAASETGKTIDQADTEVSEAIDFANYYGSLAPQLADLDGATFTPARLTVVTPPWNFPIAIPAGGVLAALAAGSAVVLKPAPPARRCGAELARAMWDAGVPRDVLALADLADGEISQALVTHAGVDRVILTGSYETAKLFRSWRADLPLLAETSGKNAIIVTPSADFDLAVRDIVASAFSHAGQKCSAASLVILVGSVATSRRFRDQLVDAVASLRVGLDPVAQVGPVVMPDDAKLRRGLTELGAGEHWVVKPQQRDPDGRLWSPGLRAGVLVGSEFHLTEYFGPILGVMTAPDLDAALEIANGVEYGLTSGLHSLDHREIDYWLERIQAGNLYVNRGITGAIVRRQPFGGWKRSAIGPGAKAGGPNYLLALGSLAPTVAAPGSNAAAPATPDIRAVPARLHPLLLAAQGHLSSAEWQGLVRACASDAAMWDARYGRAVDTSGLTTEANLLRYRPTPVTIRAGEAAALADLVRVTAAGLLAGSILTLSHGSELPAAVAQELRTARVTLRRESEEQWLSSAAAWAGAEPLDARVRLIASDRAALAHATAGSPDIAVWADPVTESGHVELLPFLHEQSVSITTHRYGAVRLDVTRM